MKVKVHWIIDGVAELEMDSLEAAGPVIRIGIISIHGENAGNVTLIDTAAAGEILLTGLKAERRTAAIHHTAALNAVNRRRLGST